ncbi:MAG: hypothetical protein EOO77_30090, partial [Oxalobacteraceae bacterium]
MFRLHLSREQRNRAPAMSTAPAQAAPAGRATRLWRIVTKWREKPVPQAQRIPLALSALSLPPPPLPPVESAVPVALPAPSQTAVTRATATSRGRASSFRAEAALPPGGLDLCTSLALQKVDHARNALAVGAIDAARVHTAEALDFSPSFPAAWDLMRRCAEAYEDAEDSTAQAECEVLLLKALKACRNREAPGNWRNLAAIANGVFGRTGQSWVKSSNANELERHQDRCQADLALYRARDSLDADDSQRAVT